MPLQLSHTSYWCDLQQILVADFDESSEAVGKQQQHLGTSQSPESPKASQLVSTNLAILFGVAGVVAACGMVVLVVAELVRRRKRLKVYELVRSTAGEAVGGGSTRNVCI